MTNRAKRLLAGVSAVILTAAAFAGTAEARGMHGGFGGGGFHGGAFHGGGGMRAFGGGHAMGHSAFNHHGGGHHHRHGHGFYPWVGYYGDYAGYYDDGDAYSCGYYRAKWHQTGRSYWRERYYDCTSS